jgi:hypothetical protein
VLTARLMDAASLVSVVGRKGKDLLALPVMRGTRMGLPSRRPATFSTLAICLICQLQCRCQTFHSHHRPPHKVMAFDRHTLPTGDEEALAASANFTGLVLHLCSLLHATCCQALRRDPNLGNLSLHGTKEPPTVSRAVWHRVWPPMLGGLQEWHSAAMGSRKADMCARVCANVCVQDT